MNNDGRPLVIQARYAEVDNSRSDIPCDILNADNAMTACLLTDFIVTYCYSEIYGGVPPNHQ